MNSFLIATKTSRFRFSISFDINFNCILNTNILFLLWECGYRKLWENVWVGVWNELAKFTNSIAEVCYSYDCKYAEFALLSWISNCKTGIYNVCASKMRRKENNLKNIFDAFFFVFSAAQNSYYLLYGLQNYNI